MSISLAEDKYKWDGNDMKEELGIFEEQKGS